MRGTLVLVVGPSGAGKYTLIRGAKAALGGDWGYVFPAREITRPIGAGGEAHVPVGETLFHRRRAQGAYSLSWRAHGLWYGIPRAMEDSLAAGRAVVINASRSVIEEARRRYARRVVLNVSAPAAVLQRRLQMRGRESAHDVAARLARAGAFQVAGPDVVTLVNDMPREQAIEAFVGILRGLRVPA